VPENVTLLLSIEISPIGLCDPSDWRLPRQAPRIVACFCISKPLSHRFVLYIIKLHLHWKLFAEKYEKYQIQPLSK
jgi:hypothetical protein